MIRFSAFQSSRSVVLLSCLAWAWLLAAGCKGDGGSHEEEASHEGDASAGQDAPTDGYSPEEDVSPAEDAHVGPTDCAEPGSGNFVITSVIGSIGDGLPVVVCGGGFGELGPTHVLFDDMESGHPGDEVMGSDPLIGAWWRVSTRYSGEAGHSGVQAMTIGGEGSGVAEYGIPDASAELGLMHFDEIFVSWALLDLGVFPGNNSSTTTFSTDSSAKDLWLMYGNRGDNYNYSCSQGTCNGNDIVLVTHTGNGSFKIDGNNTNSNWWLSGFWQFQTWNPMSVYLKVNSDDPYGPIIGTFEHISPEGGYFRTDYNGTVMREEHDAVPPVWDRIKFGSWYRGTEGFRRVVDDVYVALGNGAAARVEIANAARIEDATRRAIATVDRWSSNRLEVTLRLGSLDSETDSLYLFVVDSNNQRSSGFPL